MISDIKTEPPSFDEESKPDTGSHSRSMNTETVPEDPRSTASKALIQAVALGDRNQIIRLLATGANMNHMERSKTTPLHMAADGDPEMCQFLLSLGADPTLKDENGDEPAAIAYRGNHTECLRKIVEKMQNTPAPVTSRKQAGI